MSQKIVLTIPEAVRVLTSKKTGQVILSIEVLLQGESPGDPGAQQRYALGPFEALALGRQLQDRSVQLLLSLAGYEDQTDTVPGIDDEPLQ